jgi:hypothetical protein
VECKTGCSLYGNVNQEVCGQKGRSYGPFSDAISVLPEGLKILSMKTLGQFRNPACEIYTIFCDLTMILERAYGWPTDA